MSNPKTWPEAAKLYGCNVANTVDRPCRYVDHNTDPGCVGCARPKDERYIQAFKMRLRAERISPAQRYEWLNRFSAHWSCEGSNTPWTDDEGNVRTDRVKFSAFGTGFSGFSFEDAVLTAMTMYPNGRQEPGKVDG